MHMRGAGRGFTLVELLVVLAMITLLVTLARPMYSAAVPGARVRAEALEMAVALRQVRNLAVSRGAPVVVYFDTANARYAVDRQVTNLPEQTTLEALQAVGSPAPEPIVRLDFNPDGSSTGAAVVLRGTTAAYRVDVDWLTGRVRLEEQADDGS